MAHDVWRDVELVRISSGESARDEECEMMELRIDRRVFVTGLATLLFCFGTVADVSARGHRSDAEAGNEDVVEAVNTTRHTVMIAGKTYAVTESSRLFDAKGRRIRLHELRSSRAAGKGDMVEYWVRRGGDDDQLEIRRLRVLEGDFE